jgi:SAM-dependent methyltransferase
MNDHSTFHCRSCGATGVNPIVSFGRTPLADALLTQEQLSKPEITASLDLVFCPNCALVQITETVPPEILFCRDYPYFSSVSKSLLEHFSKSAEYLIQTRQLNANSLVIEAASNDGYMLKNFVDKGIPVLGIDPAEGPVRKAQERGVNSTCTFFTKSLAEQLRQQGQQADVFLANNVLAHVADLNGFVDGIAALLKPEGVAVIEAPYLVDLIEHCEFDTIYHQHLCYFSVTALDRLFRNHGLFLNDVIRTKIHGGSLRLFVERTEAPKPGVLTLLEDERKAGVDKIEYYHTFADRIHAIRSQLTLLLKDLKKQGKTIAGYAAAAKATTLLSFCEIDKNLLEYVVDLNQFKQGRYMPGNHLPIYSPDKLLEKTPDYLLVLAWNFANEIMEQQKAFSNLGGRFIIPIPSPAVI